MHDPNALLADLRRLAAAIRSGGAWPSPDGADSLALTAAQLDEHLSAGGALPTSWQPPLVMREHDGRFLDVHRAERRLRDVLDRAMRDDEQTDIMLARATPAGARPGGLHDRLARILAHAIIAELETEQRAVRAMVEQQLLESARRPPLS